MTVGMNRLNQMFRDFKVAEEVGKMMELRRFEVEFELYGTVYWENGKRYYLVSKNEKIICQQIAELAIQQKYPLPLQVWREKCLVPAGWDEEIEQQTKVHFCQDLQKEYPAFLWECAAAVADKKENDEGTKILNPLQDRLDGVFQEEKLQMFCGLLQMLYLRKNLTQRSFQTYCEWIREMRQEMIHNIVSKDIFSKDFFGFAYQKENGSFCYVINASQQAIQQKRTEIMLASDNLVTPVFSKRCWYNYDYRLAQARKDYELELRALYDDNYFAILQEIQKLPTDVDAAAYQEWGKQLQTEKQRNVWKLFGRQWGVIRNNDAYNG